MGALQEELTFSKENCDSLGRNATMRTASSKRIQLKQNTSSAEQTHHAQNSPINESGFNAIRHLCQPEAGENGSKTKLHAKHNL